MSFEHPRTIHGYPIQLGGCQVRRGHTIITWKNIERDVHAHQTPTQQSSLAVSLTALQQSPTTHPSDIQRVPVNDIIKSTRSTDDTFDESVCIGDHNSFPHLSGENFYGDEYNPISHFLGPSKLISVIPVIRRT